MATLAQLTYQRFFPRYLRLGGLSGTLVEARTELIATYGTAVRRIALRRPCRRVVGPARLYPDHAALWPAVQRRVTELHAAGRPVLVATDSVADAQSLAAVLAAQRPAARRSCMRATTAMRPPSSRAPASAARSPSPPTCRAAAPTSSSAPAWPSSAGCT